MVNGLSPRSGRKKRDKRKGGTSKKGGGIRVRRGGQGNRYILMEFIPGGLNRLSNLR